MKKFFLETLSEEEIYAMTSGISTGAFRSVTYIHQEFNIDSHVITVLGKTWNTKFGCYDGKKSVKERRAKMKELGEVPSRESSYDWVAGDPKALRRDRTTKMKKYLQVVLFDSTGFKSEILIDGKKPKEISADLMTAIKSKMEPFSKKKDMFILPLFRIVNIV